MEIQTKNDSQEVTNIIESIKDLSCRLQVAVAPLSVCQRYTCYSLFINFCQFVKRLTDMKQLVYKQARLFIK